MERLTDKTRNFDGTASSPKSLVIEEGMRKGMPSAYCNAIVTKLAEYEDAEEQGLLLRLPFEVGSEIYVLKNCLHIKSGKTYFKIEKFTIRKYVYNSLKNFVIVGVKKYAGDVVEEHFFKEEIGKIVFEKYADAEAALKAKQEDK